MSLYVIENENCEVLDRVYCEFTNDVDRTAVFDEPIAPTECAKRYGGHVVELVEKPELVEVNEEEAEKLREAKVSSNPISVLWWASKHVNDTDAQNRLMRAYVNGYTVRKSKRWNVKVPHSRFYYWKWKDDEPGVGSGEDDDVLGVEPYRFSAAEIEHYDLQHCEKVEVKD